jgi:hypothetical protein
VNGHKETAQGPREWGRDFPGATWPWLALGQTDRSPFVWEPRQTSLVPCPRDSGLALTGTDPAGTGWQFSQERDGLSLEPQTPPTPTPGNRPGDRGLAEEPGFCQTVEDTVGEGS